MILKPKHVALMASGLNTQTAGEIWSHSVAHFISIGFFYYDHIISLGDEISFIWYRPKTQSAYWFLGNRYLAFLGNIVVTVLRAWPLSEQSCRKYNWFRQLLLVTNQVLACVLLTIRTYALYGRSRRVLWFMLSWGAILFGVACFSLTGQSSSHAIQQTGCHIALSPRTAVRLAIAWEALFAYDTIVFGLTIFKTYQGGHGTGALFSTSIPLIRLVARDGAIYFAIMALANFSNILTFYIGGPFMRGGLSTFASCMSVTMVSRLLLNLHRSADQGIFTTYDPGESETYTHTGILFTSWFATGNTLSGITNGNGWEMNSISPEERMLRRPVF